MELKLKVCGMRETENMKALVDLNPDFIGMIFFEKSPRFIEDPSLANIIPQTIKKVGVFVNATFAGIMDKVAKYQLDYVQLHGDESVQLATDLKSTGVGVLKVFSVTNELPVEEMILFEGVVDYFLFDTKTPNYGGSGKQFDWSILKQYTSTTPFFLSGGIDLEDIKSIKKLSLPMLYAIDVNSRFEKEPGQKDIEKIRSLKEEL